MSIIYDYINYWLYSESVNESQEEEKKEKAFLVPSPPPPPKQKTRTIRCTPVLISKELLNSVKLKSITNYPGPARNIPDISKFDLCMLTQGNLDAILNVKLKKTNFPKRKNTFPPRNPLLVELHNTIKIVN